MIKLVDLSYQVDGKLVLDRVNLEVGKGEIVAIMGRSGSGKTTILHLINGLVRPTGGEIWVEGREISRLNERQLNQVRRRMALVFQYSALFDSMTVADNVAFALRQHHLLPAREIPEAVASRLELVGMEGSEALLPAQLSGGMQKRVAVARALAMAPEIILYDEPTSGLDPVAAHEVDSLMRQLRSKLQVTSLVVSHDVVSLFRLADRIAVLHDGQFVALGTTAELLTSTVPIVRQFIEGRLEMPARADADPGRPGMERR